MKLLFSNAIWNLLDIDKTFKSLLNDLYSKRVKFVWKKKPNILPKNTVAIYLNSFIILYKNKQDPYVLILECNCANFVGWLFEEMILFYYGFISFDQRIANLKTYPVLYYRIILSKLYLCSAQPCIAVIVK